MIRKQTASLRALNEDLKRPQRLLKIERQSFDDPPKTAQQRVGVEGLRGGAVVLMSATLEAYLKEVFNEVVQDLEVRRSTGKKASLDAKLFLTSDFDGVEAVLRDHVGDRSTKHNDLKRVARAIHQGQLVGDGFARTDANPRPEVVSKMMGRLGIKDPFGALETKANQRSLAYSSVLLRTKLDELMDRRNEVAHGQGSLNLTRVQLQEYVKFVSDLCSLIDAVIVEHYRQICS